MNTPILKFDNIQEAVNCLNDWKAKLGLLDWTIKIMICEPHEFVLEGCDGECESVSVKKAAIIRILKPEYYGDRIQKYCAEKILVHELLHCKLSLIEKMTNIEDLLHQTHEDIARALICSKYNIPLDWFDSINYEEL